MLHDRHEMTRIRREREAMARAPSYQGIRFPERAERLADFGGYRVFLDHWDDLSISLGEKFEGVALRGESRVLAIHAEQGRGKTLFAQQLSKDFDRTKTIGAHSFDENNLWHRVVGGIDKDVDLVSAATSSAECIHIEDDQTWLKKLLPRLEGNKERNFIIIADNAERSYFRQGLVNLEIADYLTFQDRPDFLTMVAQHLVHLCRTTMARCLLVALSNDERFLVNLQNAVESQHEGLLELKPLPVPGSQAKEAIVRINTNRLNRISYWYCLDKAGPEDKKAVFLALSGADSFPASFQAVNTAIRQATAVRTGRPAKKNVISLIILGNSETAALPSDLRGEIEFQEVSAGWLTSTRMKAGWTDGILDDDRERGLLESEWQLRVVLLGNPFVRSLLSPESDSHKTQLLKLFEFLKPVYGPGTHTTTREQVRLSGEKPVKEWVDAPSIDLTAFWSQGQTRANHYEPRLAVLLPEYNRSANGFLSYRPDAVIVPFHPCSILNSISADQTAINSAIRRDAHVLEFCALTAPDALSIRNYLRSKLPNYVSITQEQ